MGILDGKRAIVTGSSRGVGRGYAKAMAAQGARVVVSGTTADLVQEVVAEIRDAGGEATPCVASISTFDGAERLVQTGVDAYGGVDILVNNAGVIAERMMFNMTDQEFSGPMQVDYYGTFACSRHAARLMRQQQWGRIVNTGDTSGLHGLLGGTNVGAAKGGIHAMTMIWAIELAKYNITVNCIIPGAYSRMHDPLITKALEVRRQRGETNVPTFEEMVAATPKPEETLDFLLYLCSDEAGWINGQIFTMNKAKISLWSRPVQKIQWHNPQGVHLDEIRAHAREVFGGQLEYLGRETAWMEELEQSTR